MRGHGWRIFVFQNHQCTPRGSVEMYAFAEVKFGLLSVQLGADVD